MNRLKLLLVDDDLVDRRAVRRTLAATSLEVDVIEATDADGALAAVGEHSFDCIFLDLMLPGRDGLDVLRAFAARGVDAPVVMLTGHEDLSAAVELMKAGAVDYICKAHLTPQRIAQSIQHAMRLRRAEREAREAQRAREELLAIVAHDLRTPLGVVVSSIEALQEALPAGPPGDGARALAALTQRAALQMAKLIGDLLDTSSIEAGHLRLDLQDHDVAALLHDATELLALPAKQKAIRIETRLSGAGRVRCDRDRILQVLCNLVGNAIKFAPEGSVITLEAQVAAEVTLRVTDDGPGIPEPALPHIFERYWTGRGKAGEDTGLGLYIAKRIIDAHEGRIAVTTGAGSGTSFSVTLPLPPVPGP